MEEEFQIPGLGETDLPPETPITKENTEENIEEEAPPANTGDRHVDLARESPAIKPDNVSQEVWDNRYKKDFIGRQFPGVIQGLEKTVHTGSSAGLGTIDFLADASGLIGKHLNIPWLEKADEWWDNNSPRSKDPLHTFIRDASAIIVPTLYGGKVLVGGVAAATKAVHIPTATRTLGTILGYAGIESSVAAISSQSYEQDNICLLYTYQSPREQRGSRMPTSA